ncbi:MAG: Glycoside hydrolase, family 57 [Thermoanaerobacterales bacterium 50_218]|nr:MAG: Glycoside hydrolase, family 57 [Thermoanaerobacterales bacterium 50_218]HAA90708.1 glycoside hydrolase [Peptococcaceae bacterium]
MERYICIHGHFYQPPRENPWLEAIELQDSAYPYHDWNERITDECYAPNAASRILNGKGRIKKIVNNYSRISFNFGPTLLSWLETNEPEVYQAIIEADQESQKRFSGHGSAIAQTYNHMIMPLANRRDKYTQVIWGIRDFEHRFQRKPEGMWLPEIAVDLETLEIMAEQGIKFTILAPHQARKVRKIGSDHWQEVGPGGIDPTMPYQVRFRSSGKLLSIFFYDGPISRSVAFEDLLISGEYFAHRLLTGFLDSRTWHQIVNIATDGETYGHHHRHGDMALAYALDYIESNKLAVITNYGEYLEKHPPTHEVEIIENTSWSCAHGIERWRNNCGCNSGLHPGWSQAWRAPLRNALNWLRNTLAPQFEQHCRVFLKDPWTARNDYISVILDRSPENIQEFLRKHSLRELSPEEVVTVLKLLELQRHAMLMFTSCGWFFDDISGIETIQVLQYSGRVIQLAQELFGASELEPRFLEMLSQAKSNLPEYQHGARIYEKFVKPAIIDLPKVCAHYAISSIFKNYGNKARIYCYTVSRQDCRKLAAGKARLEVGKAEVASEITKESMVLSYGVVYLGNHALNAGVRTDNGKEAYQELVESTTEAFRRGDLPEVIWLLDHHFEGRIFTLKHLFRDEQRKILNLILESAFEDAEAAYRQIYERNAPLMRFLKGLGIPQPKALHTAAEFVLNTKLRRKFLKERLDMEEISALLSEVRALDVPLDEEGLSYALQQTVEKMAEKLRSRPTDLLLLEHLQTVIELIDSLPFEVNLRKAQNIYYKMLQTIYHDLRGEANQGSEIARTWAASFLALGEKLKIRKAIEISSAF